MLTKCKSDLFLISVGHCQGCPLSFLLGLVRSLVIQQWFGIEPLHLHIKGSQLRWFGQSRMPPGPPQLAEVFWACNTGKRLWGKPRIGWRDYVFELAWEHLNVHLDEQEEVARVREIWAYLLRLLSPWRPDKCHAFSKPQFSFSIQINHYLTFLEDFLLYKFASVHCLWTLSKIIQFWKLTEKINKYGIFLPDRFNNNNNYYFYLKWP